MDRREFLKTTAFAAAATAIASTPLAACGQACAPNPDKGWHAL